MNFDDFFEYHLFNPEIYEQFKIFTFELVKHNKRGSGWMVVNRIRWFTTVEAKNSEYKVSNDAIAFYTRLFMYEFPEHKKFFKTKRMNCKLPDWLKTERDKEYDL